MLGDHNLENSFHVFVCCQAAFRNAAPIFGHERITFSIAAGTQFKPGQHVQLVKGTTQILRCSKVHDMLYSIPIGSMYGIFTYISLAVLVKINHNTIDPIAYILGTKITSSIFGGMDAP